MNHPIPRLATPHLPVQSQPEKSQQEHLKDLTLDPIRQMAYEIGKQFPPTSYIWKPGIWKSESEQEIHKRGGTLSQPEQNCTLIEKQNNGIVSIEEPQNQVASDVLPFGSAPCNQDQAH